MKRLLILLSIAFITSVASTRSNRDARVHSYLMHKADEDTAQSSIEVRTCIRQEIVPTMTAPGEGYYQTFVDPANVNYALSITGSSVPFSGAAIETNFNLGSTVAVTLLAQVAGFPDYQFDADIFIDPINPTILTLRFLTPQCSIYLLHY